VLTLNYDEWMMSWPWLGVSLLDSSIPFGRPSRLAVYTFSRPNRGHKKAAFRRLSFALLGALAFHCPHRVTHFVHSRLRIRLTLIEAQLDIASDIEKFGFAPRGQAFP
jgi:hypothetical protein